MRIDFNTSSRIILTSLILLTIASIILLQVEFESLHPLVISLVFCSAFYYRYLNIKKLQNIETKTYALQNAKYVRIFNLITLMIFAAVLLYSFFTSKNTSNLIWAIGLMSAALINWFYPISKSIMIDNRAIYAKGLGKKLWKNIKEYSVDRESERILFVFNDEMKYSIAFNKYTDIQSLEDELKKRINCNA